MVFAVLLNTSAYLGIGPVLLLVMLAVTAAFFALWGLGRLARAAWRVRVVRAAVVALLLAVVLSRSLSAAYYYDLKTYCSVAWWDIFSCWGI